MKTLYYLDPIKFAKNIENEEYSDDELRQFMIDVYTPSDFDYNTIYL